MKQIRTIVLSLIAVCSAVTMLSCASGKTAWISDFEEAQKLAEQQQKDIFLFFSGEDYDGVSTQMRTTIFEKEDFIKTVGKKYVLVHLDFSNSVYEATQIAEDATEEEKAAAAEQTAILEKNYAVAMNYSVSSMPTILLLSQDGYVYGTVPYDATITTPAQYIEQVATFNEKAEFVNKQIPIIESAEGIEKVYAIDALYESLDPAYRYLMLDLAVQVPELDPENKSGVTGKYEVQLAYSNAVEAMINGDIIGATNALLAPISTGHLNNEEKQELYYQVAYFYSLMGTDYTASVLDYLQKAYDAAPDSEIAGSIKMTIDTYSREAAQ